MDNGRHLHLRAAPPRIPHAAALIGVGRRHLTRTAPVTRAVFIGYTRPQVLPDVLRELHTLNSSTIGATIDALIAVLDQRDGDTDLEPNGDERDMTATFAAEFASDPLYAVPAAEWIARGLASEDAEDDDPDMCAARDDHVGISALGGDCLAGDPDDAEDDELDTDNAEDEALTGEAVLDSGPGCIIADPPAIDCNGMTEPVLDDLDFRPIGSEAARARHRDRIRRTRCERISVPHAPASSPYRWELRA